MKSEAEIREMFYALVAQRDACTENSAARTMLNERIRALAWIIEHREVNELRLSDDAFAFYNCLG